MTQTRLLAIDPGLATGLAFFDMTPEIPVLLWTKEVNIEEFWETVPQIITTTQEDLYIVCEDFIITTETAKKSIGGNWSIELIGLVKYLGWKNGSYLKMQKPGDRTTISHEQIKVLDYWHRGGAGHANQAIRHAVVFMLDVLKNKAIARKLIEA